MPPDLFSFMSSEKMWGKSWKSYVASLQQKATRQQQGLIQKCSQKPT
jgi:hypothetical protein